MSEDADFFAVPPADPVDAPILLGEEPPAFAAAPVVEDTPYLGEVSEEFTTDAPIVLLGGPEEEEPIMMPESSEPSPMSVWNDEWQETLKTRKEEENARKAELVEEARVAMELFNTERDMKRQGKMAKNREDEQVKLEAIEADLENDNSWQRVCKMVELSHDSTLKSEDVKRMRDVLITLKNEPTRAEALTN
jgi:hypothetical protein